MTSELRVDKIHNEGGDNDSGLDMSTNDTVKINIAGAKKVEVDSSGRVIMGTATTSHAHANADDLIIGNAPASGETRGITIVSGTDASGTIHFSDGTSTGNSNIEGQIAYAHNDDSLRLMTASAERMRLDNGGNVFIGATAEFVDGSGSSAKGIQLGGGGLVIASRDGSVSAIFGRSSDDGQVVQIRQDGNTEGTISVSGSTVSYGGFVGLHESSGIATSTPVGTVVSTIDELDVYPVGTPKAGQNRADHAKVKVSDAVGDKRVYGVVQKFDAEYYNKLQVASVGIGSIRVTGACAGGDLLESNGDGTAKVQSDDIVKSKTIGKVTIGNSNTGVKLVSCVLYCG